MSQGAQDLLKGPWALSFFLHENSYEFESWAVVCAKEQNKMSQGAQDLLKEPWALSFFLHGLGSTLFTAVGSQQHREITISRKRAKKSAMGRRVPK
jgi:4-diphosphocytidyl-2C-methyl-D-erythritol kinase